jgi:hypothetical protein
LSSRRSSATSRPRRKVLSLRDLAFEILPFRRHVAALVAEGTAPWWTLDGPGRALMAAMMLGFFDHPGAVFLNLRAAWVDAGLGLSLATALVVAGRLLRGSRPSRAPAPSAGPAPTGVDRGNRG